MGKRKGKGSLGEKGKGKCEPPYFFTWNPLHIQKPPGAPTHETKRFPGHWGLPKGELTPPNLRYVHTHICTLFANASAAMSCMCFPHKARRLSSDCSFTAVLATKQRKVIQATCSLDTLSCMYSGSHCTPDALKDSNEGQCLMVCNNL